MSVIRIAGWASVAALCVAVGCASAEYHQEVTVARDAQVTIGSAPPLTLKKGEKFVLGSEPALVESPGQISVLLLPPIERASDAKVKVGFRPGEMEEKHASPAVANELIFGVEAIESLLAAGKVNEAFTRIEEFEAKNPKAAAIKFLRARCVYALGDAQKGRELFEEAKRLFPRYRVDNDFLEPTARRAPASSGTKKTRGSK